MASGFDSSGLHSLAELRARAEQQARLQASRESARLAQERRESEARALAHESEVRQRAALGALEAERDAAEQRVRGVLAEQAATHRELQEERAARRSQELSATSRLLRQRLLGAGLLAASGAALAALLLVYFCALLPAQERTLIGVREQLELSRRERLQAERERQRLARSNDELASKLHQQRERSPEPSSVVPQSTVRKLGPTRVPDPSAPAKPCRDDGDPLNPCLKR